MNVMGRCQAPPKVWRSQGDLPGLLGCPEGSNNYAASSGFDFQIYARSDICSHLINLRARMLCTKSVQHREKALVKYERFGSPAWIRTTIHGSKGRCPTIRRPGNECDETYTFSVALSFHSTQRA